MGIPKASCWFGHLLSPLLVTAILNLIGSALERVFAARPRDFKIVSMESAQERARWKFCRENPRSLRGRVVLFDQRVEAYQGNSAGDSQTSTENQMHPSPGCGFVHSRDSEWICSGSLTPLRPHPAILLRLFLPMLLEGSANSHRNHSVRACPLAVWAIRRSSPSPSAAISSIVKHRYRPDSRDLCLRTHPVIEYVLTGTAMADRQVVAFK
jgi:hypothetical protein